MKPYKTLTKNHLNQLISIVGKEHISVKETDLDQHAKDESFHQAHRPAAVVWPGSAQEISEILAFANQENIPVTPWGAGTSLEGNPIPIFGGIVLDTLRMDKVLEVRVDDFQVDVQAGAKYKDMNALLGKQGLFFPPDPGANASIGGMIANNAAGTRTPRYGMTMDNVLSLEVVMPSGEIIRTGTQAPKSSSGYDLVHLFIGSEGTLGIITEATLKLSPLPEKFSAAVAAFPSMEAASRTVSNIMGSGITPAALELIDPATMVEFNTVEGFDMPLNPTLLMEFHSSTDAGLAEELDVVHGLCKDEDCLTFEAGMGRSERDRLWKVRHQNYEILVRNNPGKAILVLDVAVPVSKYPNMVKVSEKALKERGLKGYVMGHAGDGNLHPAIIYTPDDEDSFELALEADKVIVKAAIEMGGTATGEHGVGIGKKQFMELEHGHSLEVMKMIKDTLDPNGILNPGKIF